ncbi:MAG: AtpZ/AtpI family protein [Planctomycetota bacterium]|nr:AtpZ/AtpI family protein [Planctomycetota bacterium]
MPNPGPSPPAKRGDSSALWKVSGLGMELAGSILGMALVGWLIDQWIGTQPKGTIICLSIGILGGGYNFVRSAQRLNRQTAADYRRQRHETRQADPDAAAPKPFPKITPPRADWFARQPGQEAGDGPDADADERLRR